MAKAKETTREYVNLKLVGFLAYPKFNRPDEYKGRKSYQTGVYISDNQAEKLEEDYGITAQQDKERAKEVTGGHPDFKGGFILQTKRYEERGKPAVLAADGEDLSDKFVATGTKAIVDVTIGNDSVKQGKTLWLNRVTVKELKEFTPRDGMEESNEEFEKLFG